MQSPRLAASPSTSGRSAPAALRCSFSGPLSLSLVARPCQACAHDRRVCTNATAAATVDLPRLPLATYKFPRIPQAPVMTHLEDSVREAVKHLAQAPFLQLHSGTNGTTRHSVADSVLTAPQLWLPIGEHLNKGSVDMLLLVHSLKEPCSSSGYSSGSSPGPEDVFTGFAAHNAHQSKLLSLAELVKSGAAEAEFSGHVGNCCEEAVTSQVVPFTKHHAVRQSWHEHRHEHTHRSNSQQQHAPQYWGVIVQSRGRSDAEGCYVLKTSQADQGADCHCTYFTMTRVCRGQAIADQLRSAWLV